MRIARNLRARISRSGASRRHRMVECFACGIWIGSVRDAILFETMPEKTYISWVAVPPPGRFREIPSNEPTRTPCPRRALLQSDQLIILANGCDGISVMQSYWQDVRSLTKGAVRIVLTHNKNER